MVFFEVPALAYSFVGSYVGHDLHSTGISNVEIFLRVKSLLTRANFLALVIADHSFSWNLASSISMSVFDRDDLASYTLSSRFNYRGTPSKKY